MVVAAILLILVAAAAALYFMLAKKKAKSLAEAPPAAAAAIKTNPAASDVPGRHQLAAKQQQQRASPPAQREPSPRVPSHREVFQNEHAAAEAPQQCARTSEPHHAGHFGQTSALRPQAAVDRFGGGTRNDVAARELRILVFDVNFVRRLLL